MPIKTPKNKVPKKAVTLQLQVIFGEFANDMLYMHVFVYILSCPLNVMSFVFFREEPTGILEMVVYES